jgi:hypothetical protein
MPAPRVFVSSTCYDLRYIRENLRSFVRGLGYEPVLSEDGAVFYDPSVHVQDACLVEVPSCQMMVLIIGGRYGSQFKETEKSITNAEYLEAVKAKIPVFALVERPVYEQYRLFLSNKSNTAIDAAKITYPNTDSVKIFEFIEEVQTQSSNNALVPFSDFEEMQAYLKQQWASMLFRFLTNEGEAKRVGETLASLSAATANIEFLTRQVVRSVGDPVARAAVEFYDYLIGFEVVRDLAIWNLSPSPKAIVIHATLDDFCKNQITPADDDDDDYGDTTLTYGGPPYRLGTARYASNKKQYATIRGELLRRLQEKGITIEQFVGGE